MASLARVLAFARIADLACVAGDASMWDERGAAVGTYIYKPRLYAAFRACRLDRHELLRDPPAGFPHLCIGTPRAAH